MCEAGYRVAFLLRLVHWFAVCFFQRAPQAPPVFVNDEFTFQTRTHSEPRQPMACTDTVSDVNNALHTAEDEAAPVITLEYGPYMN